MSYFFFSCGCARHRFNCHGWGHRGRYDVQNVWTLGKLWSIAKWECEQLKQVRFVSVKAELPNHPSRYHARQGGWGSSSGEVHDDTYMTPLGRSDFQSRSVQKSGQHVSAFGETTMTWKTKKKKKKKKTRSGDICTFSTSCILCDSHLMHCSCGTESPSSDALCLWLSLWSPYQIQSSRFSTHWANFHTTATLKWPTIQYSPWALSVRVSCHRQMSNPF